MLHEQVIEFQGVYQQYADLVNQRAFRMMIDMMHSHVFLRSNVVIWLAAACSLTTACGDDQPGDTGAGTSDSETTATMTGDGGLGDGDGDPGDGDPGDGEGDTGDGDGEPGDGEPDPSPDHEGALGCAGVYNPDQILDLHLAMAPGDWQTVLGDLTFETYVQAQFHCGDEAPITVGVRRKRSGGTNKVGLKVDFNQVVMGQRWQDLRKLSLENGVSSGSAADDADVHTLVAEYLAWRIMQRGTVISSRAAFVNLHVNDMLIGTYVNVEQVDTRFLTHRFGDNDGWLVKKSGGAGDGPQTHELDGLEDPYAAFFCFWENGGQACPQPPDDVLLADLPLHLDIPQMLRMGAAQAYIANTDSPLSKDNNWYYYDWAGGGRAYMPTDLDTTMNDFTNVLNPEGHHFDTILFTHWMPDYEAFLTELVVQQAPAAVVLEELDRVLEVAGPSLDADPWTAGTTAEAVATLGDWWIARDADVRVQLGL
jgi:hypothetical protein